MDFTRASRTQNLIGAYLSRKFLKMTNGLFGAALGISICLTTLMCIKLIRDADIK